MVTVVTARQVLTLAPTRRAAVRRAFVVMSLFSVGCATVLSLSAGLDPAIAQSFTFNPRAPAPPKVTHNKADDGKMLVQANEMDYDNVHSQVSAVGNVQIFYNGSTLEADRVIYDQKTKRLHAEGNVRLTDADGKVTTATILDLSDDYRDGFIDSLRVDSADQTRVAATRAERTEGNFTVFQSGVYTACAPCRDDPKKPPLWQVKAARIIHDQGEKLLYFENARLEFFGVPLAYVPYFYMPDPSVKKKTGFLIPWVMSSSKFGYGLEVPYYWAIAPDYDATIMPRYTTRQGLFLQGEFRQRLVDGSYQIRAYGIDQQDKNAFLRNDGTATPGFRNFRGAIETSGQFSLNERWTWGWDGTLVSDKTFFQDYSVGPYKNFAAVFASPTLEATSDLYLTGVGNRSFFDARTIYYYGLSEADNQKEIPIIHPVIDYNNVINRNIFGGEVSYKANFTSLSRDAASFDAISTNAVNLGLCMPTTADPTVKIPANCLLRGVPGTYTRLSAQADWRRTFIDPFGQVWTPFASLRGDVANADISNQPGVANYLATGDTSIARVMPTIGLEYKYPFISVQPWGTQTVTPIAQVIARPNEPSAGRLPNEDAQSLTFDDTNLFRVDKFSGWDRIEGGGRANVGVEATTQFNRGGFVNMLFGQSYQLFGLNSFAVADATNTGIASGLQTARSDYVGRVSYQPSSRLQFTARTRLDEQSLDMKRLELETRANFDRWSVSFLYGNYAPQPELGFLNRREGFLSSASLKFAPNWVLSGGLRYDLHANSIDQTIFGAGYVDDCFVLALNYITDYTVSGNVTADHRIMFQLGLRTIGNTAVGETVGAFGSH
jgi:LPS-assembly protein